MHQQSSTQSSQPRVMYGGEDIVLKGKLDRLCNGWRWRNWCRDFAKPTIQRCRSRRRLLTCPLGRIGPSTGFGLGHQQMKGLIWQFFSAESGTGRPDASHPRAAQKKKKKKEFPRRDRRARRAVSCAPRVVLIVSMPRQKAAVSCG